MQTIYTGASCTCKRGQERDNCPRCEGSGRVIDFAAMRASRNNTPTADRRPYVEPEAVGLFRGVNCVTPNREGPTAWAVRGRLAYEVATGSGIFDPSATLWGLTFQRPDKRYQDGAAKPRRGVSGLFHSRHAAYDRLARVLHLCELFNVQPR
ncbi:MAG: hypothetical protein FJ125_08305 [Deltaproteobacteria bacterium]|nr:hypothetical protein [Deltaproteobacteria bacterium]